MTPWALTFVDCSFLVSSTNYRQYTILNLLQVLEKHSSFNAENC